MSDNDLIRRGDALAIAADRWAAHMEQAQRVREHDDETAARLAKRLSNFAREADAIRNAIAALAPAQPAPHLTDLMVDPESIDAFLEANPLTPKPVDDSLAADPAVKTTLAEALTVPEVKALVEAAQDAREVFEEYGSKAREAIDYMEQVALAALRQIGGE